MPNLVLDSSGKPSPQYLNESGSEFEYQRGKDGGMNVNLNGVTHKLPKDMFTGKVIPTQLITENGEIVNKFGSNNKSGTTIFTQSNKSGSVTSSVIDSSEVDNITFFIITTELVNLTEFTVQGEFNGEYHSIYTITKDDIVNTKGVITMGINANSPIVIPSKIKIVLTLSTSTTIATYMVSK